MATRKRSAGRAYSRKRFNYKSKSSFFTALIAALSIGILGVALLRSSFAATIPICEIYSLYCVGAPSIGLGAAVRETSDGRRITQHKTSVGSDVFYQLEFTADTSKCIGIDNHEYTIVKNCTGNDSSYTGWYKYYSNGYAHWENRATSLNLTGHGNGGQMFLWQRDLTYCPNLCYQSFDN